MALNISDLLAIEGYAVETATDGEAGLTKAMSGKFDLLVLDVMLPKKADSRYAANCGRVALLSRT